MRPPRKDEPGAWWLLTNRGLAKRVVFETRRDALRFLDLVADVVGRGDLEIHAFVLMVTHFHILARSPRGELSRAMQRLGNLFVRWFNRAHMRDGSLFRGRFHGRRLRDRVQWETVLRYIDLNPVRAGMVDLPSDHPYGSARAYRWGAGPGWLRRDVVESVVADFSGTDLFVPGGYDAFAADVDAEGNEHLVEHLLRSPAGCLPPLDDLVHAASRHEQDWMTWKTRLADATTPGAAFLSPGAALRAARVVARTLGERREPTRRGNPERALAAGLLRHTAGLALTEIAERLGIAVSTAHAAMRRHVERLAVDRRYEDLVAGALRQAVRRCFPAATRPGALPRRIETGMAALVVP